MTDVNGCMATGTITLVDPPLLTVFMESIDPSCKGASDGWAGATPSGGTGPYTITWSNGATGLENPSIPAGTYTATVTDANGCMVTGTVTLLDPDGLTVLMESIDPTCNGGSDGWAGATPEGGTPPYTITWSNGATGLENPAIPAGTYTATVTDANGCIATGTVTLINPPGLTVFMESIDPTCNGGSDGWAGATPSGGTGPYTITWSNGAMGLENPSIPAGTYTATVTDANGCMVTGTVTLLDPDGLTVLMESIDPTCNGGSDGWAGATPEGGTPPYTITWSNGATGLENPAIPAGTYTATVTDANGCIATGTVTLINPPGLTVFMESIDPTCNGGSDGWAGATPSGGTGPYTITWSNGAMGLENPSIPAGTYTATVTDANGCMGTGTITLVDPPVLTVLMESIDPTSCGASDGWAGATPFGGTGPYTITWSNGATGLENPSIPAGTYTATVTDANGCMVMGTVILTDPPGVTVLMESIDPTCNGASDGWAGATPSGGTGPYTITWSNGAMGLENPSIPAGTYTATVTDVNGCMGTGTITLVDPPVLTVLMESIEPTCNGASDGWAGATPGGGTGPYTITWSNGAMGLENPSIPAGTYTATVTDANGCMVTGTITLVNPPALTVLMESIDPTCNGASDGWAGATPGGGTGPYTITWSNGAMGLENPSIPAGTYTATVTDANGCMVTGTITLVNPPVLTVLMESIDPTCNGASDGWAGATPFGGTGPYTIIWSNGATGLENPSIPAGTYTATVTDANGCMVTGTIMLVNPPVLTVLMESIDPTCNGASDGWAGATPSGGTGPYTITWSNGATGLENPSIPAGTYTATVTDANGCMVTGTITLVDPPVLTVLMESIDPTACGASDGWAGATPGGGTGPYTITWSNGATGLENPSIPAGTYTATVTDANGCMVTGTITLFDPPGVSVLMESIDPTCAGASDGWAGATPSGGTGPYTITWSNGAMGLENPSIPAGTYTATVTDANGCMGTGTITLVDPPVLTVLMESIDPTACGASDGWAGATPGGGTPPYTITWSNGATGLENPSIPAGTYTATVTDANGCMVTGTITLFDPPGVSVLMESIDPTCAGASDGWAGATPSGGTGPYTITWSNGATGLENPSIPAGTYTATVTDANGCMGTGTITLVDPPVLTVLMESIDPTACGASDGWAGATPGGGTGPYTITWSNGATGLENPSIPAGTYTATVTDANGCMVTGTITLFDPPGVSVLMESIDPTCAGASDGWAGATPSGGTGPYTITWSNGATGLENPSIPAGTYTATVTDANGCMGTGTITLVDPPVLTVLMESIDPTACGASDGWAGATPGGGTGPYTITWSNGATGLENPSIPAGTYTATVTDANGCMVTGTITLFDPPGVSVLMESIDPTCAGASDGWAGATPSGGTGPYTITWSNGAMGLENPSIPAGTYTATVTDANGCMGTGTITLVDPPVLTVLMESIDPTACGASDGWAGATPGGGTGPYTITWSNGATGLENPSIPAGTYTATVTDANGCMVTGTITLFDPPGVSVLMESIDPTCVGASDGWAGATPSGGTPPYTITWSNGATGLENPSIPAGTYTATVTDANGCATTGTITLVDPPALTVLMEGEPAACNGGEGWAGATPFGGTPPYTINWAHGPVGLIVYEPAGTYTATVTDANGCTVMGTFTITEPTAVAVLMESIDPTCAGASDGWAGATPSGGTVPYSIAWSNGATGLENPGITAGTYTATVTDGNGCTGTGTITLVDPPALTVLMESIDPTTCGGSDGWAGATPGGGTPPYTIAWSNGATGLENPGITAGTYMATVTDANGCEEVGTVTLSDPGGPSVLMESIDPTCTGASDGWAGATPSGGTPPYTITWSNGATGLENPSIPAGTYTATVTDASGCVGIGIITLVDPPTLTVLMESIDPTTCGGSDGWAGATPGGGTSPYTIAWSNGATGLENPGITAGTYMATVTDANGCEEVGTITLDNPDGPSVLMESIDPTCVGASDGWAGATPSGGTGPYTITWSNGAIGLENPSIPAGTYTATVTDANGCMVTGTITLVDPPALTVLMESIDPTTCGGSDGWAGATPGGGTPPYTIAWSNGATGLENPGITAGTYMATVTDANGCEEVGTITLVDPDGPSVLMESIDPTCVGASDGWAGATPSGGTPPYTITWSNGATGLENPSIPAGTYTATVTDANGCTATGTITLVDPPALTVLMEGEPAACNGGEGWAGATPFGGTPPYTINWAHGPVGLIVYEPAGTYTATVTDANGCTVMGTFTITEPTAVAVLMESIDPTCAGAADGWAGATPSGGTVPYSIAWSNGATGLENPGITAGTYTATVTDGNGCTGTGTITLVDPPALTVLMEGEPAACNGGEGWAGATPFGGTPPYSISWAHGPVGLIVYEPAGTYTATVTDANGCTVMGTFTITEPTAVAVLMESIDPTCAGASDGWAGATPSGGTVPYSIAWSNGATGLENPGITAGTYTATVTDGNGCTGTGTITLVDPPVLTVLMESIDPTTCGGSDGWAGATPGGGTPPYTIAWSNGATGLEIQESPQAPIWQP